MNTNFLTNALLRTVKKVYCKCNDTHITKFGLQTRFSNRILAFHEISTVPRPSAFRVNTSTTSVFKNNILYYINTT